MSDEAVYRTAPATPGLLKIYIYTYRHIKKFTGGCPKLIFGAFRDTLMYMWWGKKYL